MDTATNPEVPTLEGQLSIYDVLEQSEPDDHQESENSQ